jgi:hypothetical protein
MINPSTCKDVSEATICALCKHHSTLGTASGAGFVYPFLYICDTPDRSTPGCIDPVTGEPTEAAAVLCKERNFGACPFWEKKE